VASSISTSEAPTIADVATGGAEAWADRAFALTALIAAAMRLIAAAPGEWWLPPVIGLAALNGLVGVLFFLRRPVVLVGTTWQLVSFLPTMIGFGLAVRFAPPVGQWPWPAHVLFAAGVGLAFAAFAFLGRSFGVLPALRATVVCGPYRVIRHPAYAGELLMALACLAASPTLMALTAWLLLLPGVIWRIASEESVLCADASYVAYRAAVRWRLLPGIW
jgi:protein-S-isoprenylcysteine O-methyltransferase Ste14